MKQRIDYIDNAKGILILLMVIGHIFPHGYVQTFIYTFHMPAFFVINGILFHYSSSLRMPVHKMILQRTYSLLVPFLFFEIIAMFVQMYVYGVLLNVKGYIYGLLTLTYYNDPCWFLIATFCANVIFVLLQKIKNDYIIGTITVVITVFCYWNPLQITQPDILRSGLALGFITLGYYGSKLLLMDSKIYFFVSIVITVVVSAMQGETSFVEFNFKNPILYVLGAISGTYMILFIAKIFKSTLIEYLGKNSLIVMATHWLFIMCIHKYCGTIDLPVSVGIITLIVIVGLEFPICYLMGKYIPFLVGKRKNVR